MVDEVYVILRNSQTGRLVGVREYSEKGEHHRTAAERALGRVRLQRLSDKLEYQDFFPAGNGQVYVFEAEVNPAELSGDVRGVLEENWRSRGELEGEMREGLLSPEYESVLRRYFIQGDVEKRCSTERSAA